MNEKRHVRGAVILAALGYFVDVYDLVLFSVVRTPSLVSLGLSQEEVLTVGIRLLNTQMLGMLFGGLFWGILGDKRGRLSVLFGSIFLYSSANILNAFVESTTSYSILRFIAGVGLAGELGAGITLVSELLPKEHRGYGTTAIATIGVMGALAAAWIGGLFDWRIAYFIGGLLGFALLAIRISVRESELFQSTKRSEVCSGSILLFFKSRERFFRYLCSTLVGMPVWFVVGILITFSPEIGRALGMTDIPSAAKAIEYSYLGLVIGDLASGLLSQRLKSRKKVILLFLSANFLLILVYLSLKSPSLFSFYALCVPLGISVGYWAVFVTTAAEQFGTNLRATVTTTVPNFVRGSTVLFTILFQSLAPSLGIISSALVVSTICTAVSLVALFFLKESFHNDLNFIET